MSGRGEGTPPWRRLDPRSGAAHGLLALAGLVAALALFALVVAPILERSRAAAARAAATEARAAALEAAAAARRAEAGAASADPALRAAALSWLDEHAPVASAEAAALDLLSTVRLLAEASEVELQAAAALPDPAARGFAAPAGAPLAVVAVEARLATDHAGLARFLDAVEAARPRLRAPALEIVAATPAAGRAAEARRLSVAVTVAALRRPEE